MKNIENYRVIRDSDILEYYDNIVDLVVEIKHYYMEKYLYDKKLVVPDSEKWAKHYVKGLLNEELESSLVLNIIRGKLVGALILMESKWDSEHFGFKIGRVGLFISQYIGADDDRSLLIKAGIMEAKRRGFKLIISRTPLLDITTIQAFERNGAILTDVLLTYFRDTHPITNPEADIFDIHIDVVSNEEEQEVAKIADEVFKIDHFHADSCLSEEKSNELYRKWALNSCRGLTDVVFVAKKRSRIVGFVTCKIVEIKDFYKYGMIELIGVSETAQGRGIGGLLVTKAVDWFSQNTSSVYVGTQARNTGAIRLYEKHNFKMVFGEITQHLWIP